MCLNGTSTHLAGDDPDLDRLRRHTVPGTIVMKLAMCDIHDLRGMIRFLTEGKPAYDRVLFDLSDPEMQRILTEGIPHAGFQTR